MSGIMVRSRLQGGPELVLALERIGDEVAQRQVLADALKRSAEPIRDEARRLAPRSGDNDGKPLADTITISSTLSRNQRRRRGGRQAQAEVFVGPTAPHGHLVEFGHKLVKVRRSRTEMRTLRSGRTVGIVLSKRVVGFVAPKPFMRPAFDSKGPEVARLFQTEVFASLERAAAKWSRQIAAGKPSGVTRRVFWRGDA